MNAIMNKTNNGKRLVATVAVFALVACCFAVIAFDEVEAASVEEDTFTEAIGTGSYSVSGEQEVKLTEPLSISKATTITGNGTLTINYAATATGQSMIVLGSNNLTIDDGVTVILNMTSNINAPAATDGLHIISGTGKVTVQDGSTLTLHQAANAYGISIVADMNINGATVNFDKANGFSGALVMDNANLNITSPNASSFAIEANSEIKNNSKITGNSTVADNGAIFFGENVNVTDSTVNAGAADIRINEGVTVTATGSTISTTGELQSIEAGENTATITGGTVSAATITHGQTANSSISFDGVIYNGNGTAKDVSVTVGDGGLLANGNLNLSGAGTVTLTGKLVEGVNGKVTVPDANKGSENLIGKDNKESVTVTADDIAIFAASGQKLTASSIDIISDVVFSNGTSLTVDGTLSVSSSATFNTNGCNVIAEGLDATDGYFTGNLTITAVEAKTLGAEPPYIMGDGFQGSVKTYNGTLAVQITAGELTLVSGSYVIGTDVPLGATLNIMKGVDLGFTHENVEVYGTVNQYGTVTAMTVSNGVCTPSSSSYTITVGTSTVSGTETPGVWNALNGAVFKNITLSGEGTINVSGAMIDAELTGVYGTNTTFPLNQNMVVSGTLTVTGQATLIIQGGLEIPAGTTVYIEEGSSIIVNSGTANVIIAGNLNVYETGAFTVTDSKEVDISGTIIAEEGATLTFNAPTKLTGSASVTSMGGFTANSGLEIGTDAILSLQGAVTTTAGIKNSGTITMDGASIAGIATINMSASGAVVNIYSVSFGNTSASLEITDAGLTVGQTVAVNDNSVTIGLGSGATSYVDSAIEGLVFTESVTAKTQGSVTSYVNTLQMSGNASVNVDSNAQISETVDIVKITISSAAHAAGETVVGAGVEVAETLNVDENIDITVSGLFTVSGTMTLADGVTLSGSQTTVTGKISAYETLSDINAVYYRAAAEPRNIYTSLATAVADNSAATTKVSLEVMGMVIVTESVQVPATVNINGTGTLQIGTADNRGITVDIADGCDVRANAVVYATLHFLNDRNDRGSVVSDVTIENGNEITYTNVATALSGAQPGDVVTITGTDVTITSDLTVPAEVTLVVPIGSTVTVNDNVTLTVNGNLTTASQIKAATAFDEEVSDTASRLVINGTLQTTETGTLDQLYTYYNVAGAYYIALTTTGQYKFIEPVAVAAESDATAISIYGENTVGDVAFTGTETEPVTVTVMGAKTNGTGAENYAAAELNAGTVTLQYATLAITGWFTGSVATAEGSVDAVNVTGLVAASVEVSADVMGMTVSGTVSQAEIGQNVDDPSITIASGQVYVIGTATVNVDFEVAEGATLTITGNGAKVDADETTVSGTLVAQEAGNADITTIYVLGTFTVGSADTAAGVQPGTTTVKNLYIGVDDEWNTYTGAAVNAESALGSVQTIYLAAGNTVSEAQTDGKKATAYMVQDELYMTAYTVLNNVQINAVQTPALNGVYADYWQYQKDGKMTSVSATDMVGTIDTVSAYIIEDVYFVKFTIESGISDVYVDGELIATAGLSGSDGSVTVMLPMGQHTVTYRLDNGFSGNVTMTINGQAMTNGQFTLSADMPYLKDDVTNPDFDHPTTDDFVVYNIVITGVEATGPVTPSQGGDSGSSDEMGLTDYLLIILVVLIVVMAIMVALRLMRS